MMSTTPGPGSIPRAGAPGGVVLHIYDISTGAKILERTLLAGISVGDVYAAAEADQVELDARLPDSSRVVFLVFYDGDTGERLSPVEAIVRMS